jgi:hypothetical protein
MKFIETNSSLPPGARLAQWTAVVSGILCLGTAMAGPLDFNKSYFLSFAYWGGVALGSLGLLLLSQIIGGTWGPAIRPFLIASSRVIPWLIPLFVPIGFAMKSIYPWADPHHVTGDPVLQHKAGYLNPTFFSLRAGIYLLILTALARFFARRAPSEAEAARLHRAAHPALVLYALTITFLAIDWFMSLDPHWYSSLYGLLYLVDQALAALAFGLLAAAFSSASSRPRMRLTVQDSHDLGNLLFVFVTVWAYLSFSQYLIVWSGNLPEEVTWYLQRSADWKWVALALIGCQFAAPFVFLLFKRNKQDIRWLRFAAGAIPLMRVADIGWQLAPSLRGPQLIVRPADALAFIFVGSALLAVFLRELEHLPEVAATVTEGSRAHG